MLSCGIKILTDGKVVVGLQIKREVLVDYAKSGGGYYVILVVLFHLFFLACLIMGQIWLSEWSEDPTNLNRTEAAELRDFRLGIYGGLIGSQGYAVFARSTM